MTFSLVKYIIKSETIRFKYQEEVLDQFLFDMSFLPSFKIRLEFRMLADVSAET